MFQISHAKKKLKNYEINWPCQALFDNKIFTQSRRARKVGRGQVEIFHAAPTLFCTTHTHTTVVGVWHDVMRGAGEGGAIKASHELQYAPQILVFFDRLSLSGSRGLLRS